jgi:hypothetical protein
MHWNAVPAVGRPSEDWHAFVLVYLSLKALTLRGRVYLRCLTLAEYAS